MRFIQRLLPILLLAFAASAGLPSGSAAQAGLDPAWSQQFVGSWKLSLETPDGDQPVSLSIAPREGGLTVQIGFPELGEPIGNVARAENSLVVNFSVPVDANELPITLRLTREGDLLLTSWNVANGEFQMEARAAKQ